MDWTALAGIIVKIAEAGPTVFDSVEKAIPIAEKIGTVLFGGKTPTQADFDDVHAAIDALGPIDPPFADAAP